MIPLGQTCLRNSFLQNSLPHPCDPEKFTLTYPWYVTVKHTTREAYLQSWNLLSTLFLRSERRLSQLPWHVLHLLITHPSRVCEQLLHVHHPARHAEGRVIVTWSWEANTNLIRRKGEHDVYVWTWMLKSFTNALLPRIQCSVCEHDVKGLWTSRFCS